MMLLNVFLSGGNVVLLTILLFLYGKIVLKTRATYAVGLSVFAVLLLANNLVSVISYVTMEPFFGVEALPHLSAIGAFELLGLIVLLRITL
jgi:hypothetical protein